MDSPGHLSVVRVRGPGPWAVMLVSKLPFGGTEQGQKRCAEAKTINGSETREKRRVWAVKLRELSELERLMKLKGLLG